MDTAKLAQDIEVTLEGEAMFGGRLNAYRVLTSRRRWYDNLQGGYLVSSWSILIAGKDKNLIPLAVWDDDCLLWINPQSKIFTGGVELVLETDKKIKGY